MTSNQRRIAPEPIPLTRRRFLNLAGKGALAANDTYADENNDIESWMKTFARFLTYPAEGRSGAPLSITGMAQVGISGLSKVQVWLHRQGSPLPADDPYFTTAPWQDAQIMAPPLQWGGGLPNDGLLLPPDTLGFHGQTGRPKAWPMRYATAHWATELRDVPVGTYDLRCRTLDSQDIAQPLPRPLPRSGVNFIEKVTVTVKPI